MSRWKSRKRLVRLAVLLGCLLLSGVVLAQVSTNFDLSWHLLSGGGGSRGSDNYQIDDSLGQWAGGLTGSTNYGLDPGFWYGAAAEPALCLVGLTDVSISGATTGYTDTVYVMIAAITPTSSTLPVSHAWSTDGLISGQGTSSASYSWSTTGAKLVTLHASNCGGSADDTHDISLVSTAQEGDNYEGDDSCDVASTIATDGTAQAHTFHDAGDEDWIKFETQASKSYLLRVANVGEDVNAVMMLYDDCEEAPLASEDNAFGPTVELEWECNVAGWYFLKLVQNDPSVYGEDTNYDVSVTVDATPPSAPKSPRSAPLDEGLAIQWTRPPELDVVGYNVWFGSHPGIHGGVDQVASGDTTYHEITGLTNGQPYYVAIEAVDFSGNESDKSLEVANIPQEPLDDTIPSATVSQPTTGAVYTTSLGSVTVGGSAQDTGNNLSRAKVHNLSNSHTGWDYTLSGSSDSFFVENVLLQPGDNDIQVTVYDDAGNPGTDSLTIHRLTGSLGAAVIVGGHNETFGLQTNIDYATNRAYRVLLDAGFDAEDIFYLSPSPQDADEDGLNDVISTTTPANVHAAIQWAEDRLGAGIPFYLYMMDHGGLIGTDEFFCADGCSSSGRIRSEELDTWLDELESSSGCDQVNVIIEACHSGSFVDKTGSVTKSISKDRRVVIASTGRTNNAYASAQGAYFSDAFFSAVAGSSTLLSSFEQAKAAVETTGNNQTPWMDDNGDGLYDSSDGAYAGSRYVASYFGTLMPEILDVSVVLAEGAGTITATVERGDEPVEVAWAAVYAPSFEEPTSTSLDLGVPLIELEPDAEEEGLYTAYYNAFGEEGTYRVVIYVEDQAGNQAQPHVVRVGEANAVYLPMILRLHGG